MGPGLIWIKNNNWKTSKNQVLPLYNPPAWQCTWRHVMCMHACSILSRFLWFCDSIAVRLTKWRISLVTCYVICSECDVFCLYIRGNSCKKPMWFECSGRVTDGFPKIKTIWIGGWVGGLSSIQFFLDFWNFFNFAKPLTSSSLKATKILLKRMMPYMLE